MGKDTTVEDLRVFQKAREITKDVYDLSEQEQFTHDKDMKRKLRSLSLAIMTNVTKGYEKRAKKDFIQYLKIAKGSCYAFQAFLYLLKDLNKISDEYFAKLKEDALDVVKMSSGLIKSLEGKKAS
jgi:four helix bundle protein